MVFNIIHGSTNAYLERVMENDLRLPGDPLLVPIWTSDFTKAQGFDSIDAARSCAVRLGLSNYYIM